MKAGLWGRSWTLVHPTNRRVTFPSLAGQRGVARETLAELRAARPVQLFVTDFSRIELNHSMLAFDYRASVVRTWSGAALRGRGAPLPRVPPVRLAAVLAGGGAPAHGPGPWSRQAVPSRRATSGSRSHESTVVHTPIPRSRPETSPVE